MAPIVRIWPMIRVIGRIRAIGVSGFHVVTWSAIASNRSALTRLSRL
jgi:hypothetical protein